MKKRNFKRFISLVLSCTILVISSSHVFAIGNDKKESSELFTESPNNSFIISGIDYYSGMDIVTDINQFNHRLQVNEMSLEDGKINFNATLINKYGSSENISFSGTPYHSEITFYRNRGGVVIIEDGVTGNWQVQNLTLIKQADDLDLFPANSDFDGLPIIELTLKSKLNSDVLQFEGLLPEQFNYELLNNSAIIAPQVDSKNVFELDESAGLNQEEVQIEENWISDIVDTESLPFYDADTLKFDDPMTRTTNYTYTGVPAKVFRTLGKWGSQNNPNNQVTGYYAETVQVPGKSTYETNLVSWTYLYNGPKAIVVAGNSGVSALTTSAIKVKARDVYRCSTGDGVILGWTDGWSKFALTSSAMAVGIPGSGEIMTYVKTSKMVDEKPNAIIAILGKVLSNITYGMSEIFDNFSSKSAGSPVLTLQDTVKGQKDANEGRVIRVAKVTADGDVLAKPEDNLMIIYNITKPYDLPTVTGTKQMSTKYFFRVGELGNYADDYSKTVYTVTQYRQGAYTVTVQ